MLFRSQSPSRGGRLCGGQKLAAGDEDDPVSVPFTRGTPLWPFTPSRKMDSAFAGFSPLHEGDASVADQGSRKS